MDGNTTTTILGLPDLVLLNIVSFLCDTSVSTPMSMKMMLAFASTNKCLRNRLRNDVLPSFSIQARLNHSSAFIQYRTLKLISTYKCKVKHLAVKVGKKDSGILLELMRRFLNCSELECLETYLFHDSVDHYLFPQPDPFDDNGDMHPISQFIRETLCIFYSFDWKEFNFFLWKKYPYMTKLRTIVLYSDLNDTDWLQSILLAHPSQISSLELVLYNDVRRHLDDSIRQPIIANLKRLISSCPKLVYLQMIDQSPCSYQGCAF